MTTKNIAVTRAFNWVNKLVNKNKEVLEKVDLVIGVSPNGLVPSVLISKLLNKPLGVALSNKSEVVLSFYVEKEPKTVLLVADFIETGKTLTSVLEQAKKEFGGDLLTFSIGYSIDSAHKPTFGMKTRNKFLFPWN